MSSTASNYDLNRLYIGIGSASLAFILAMTLSFPSLIKAQANGLMMAVTMLLYGITMFASSYVEEEQHFWYWMTSAWMAWISMEKLGSLIHAGPRGSRSDSSWYPVLKYFSGLAMTLIVLASCRTLWRWNQTGQKHAGDPDISRVFLPSQKYLLWALVVATYADVALRLAMHIMPWASRAIATSASGFLCLEALLFKIAFTQADAPELLTGYERMLPMSSLLDVPLIPQAQGLFTSLAGILALTIVPFPSEALKSNRQSLGT